MSVQQEKFLEIADAIREKTGTTELIKPCEFAGKIKDVHDAGKQSAYDAFWDTFQQNGNRTDYCASFGCGWTAEMFRPKYPLRPTTVYMMFWNNKGEYIRVDDFDAFCAEHNIVLDFSQCTYATSALATLHAKRFGTLDFSKCTVMNTLFYSHNWGGGVETIDELISSETTVFHTSTFESATNLTNLTISGVIANNGLNVSNCTKLTHESLLSIINALKDFAGTTTTKTVTLGATNLDKLTDEEKAIAAAKNWTLA